MELFNRGNTTVNLDGWSVQYAGAAGTSWQVTSLSGSVAPGRYFLIQQAAGSAGTTSLPTPDATGNVNLSATAGKVALVNHTTALVGACPAGAALVDLVGYGSGVSCAEGTAAPAPSSTTAVLRKSDGCIDTGNNSADFSTGPAAPRNSGSPFKTCAGGVSQFPLFEPASDGPPRVLFEHFFGYLLKGTLSGRRP